ncbi:MAG: hypothetical protein ABH969_06635 [Pseudomonadota bacterium]
MRGGYRPNSGPKKGAKYRPRKPKPGQEVKVKTPRKPKKPPEPTEQDRIRQMLAMGTKVSARLYQEFLQRVGRGEKLTLAEKKMMEKLGEELAAEIGEKAPAAVDGKIETPLEFMLRIMNDPNEPEEFRARMATSAAPFCHARVGEGVGKKEDKITRAKSAGEGKFKAGRAPLALVK